MLSNRTVTLSIELTLFNWLETVARRQKLPNVESALIYLANMRRGEDTGKQLVGEASSVTVIRELIKQHPDKSVAELVRISGYTGPTVRTAIGRLLSDQEIGYGRMEPPSPNDLKMFPMGRPAYTYVLLPKGQERMDRVAQGQAEVIAKRREDAKPFSIKLAEAAERRDVALGPMRGAMIAFDTLDQEFNAGLHAAKEEGPYRELQAELARRGEVFKAAWAACSEWPAERQKVIDDHRKAQALASALDVD